MEALRPGGRVLLHSLAMEELNGAVGHLQTFHEDRGEDLPKQNWEKNLEEGKFFKVTVVAFAACKVSCYATMLFWHILKHSNREADGLSKWDQVHRNCWSQRISRQSTWPYRASQLRFSVKTFFSGFATSFQLEVLRPLPTAAAMCISNWRRVFLCGNPCAIPCWMMRWLHCIWLLQILEFMQIKVQNSGGRFSAQATSRLRFTTSTVFESDAYTQVSAFNRASFRAMDIVPHRKALESPKGWSTWTVQFILKSVKKSLVRLAILHLHWRTLWWS